MSVILFFFLHILPVEATEPSLRLSQSAAKLQIYVFWIQKGQVCTGVVRKGSCFLVRGEHSFRQIQRWIGVGGTRKIGTVIAYENADKFSEEGCCRGRLKGISAYQKFMLKGSKLYEYKT